MRHSSFPFVLILLTFCFGYNRISAQQENINLDSAVSYTLRTVNDVLNRPIVVIGENKDTLLQYSSDTILGAERASTIIINKFEKLPGAIDDITPIDISANELEKEQIYARTVAIAIIAPCATIFLVIIAVFIFLLYKNREKNRLIAKAIENNYQLPDSFYCGSATNIYESKESGRTYNSTPQTDREGQQLPPLPNIPPAPVNLFEKNQFTNGVTLTIVGLMIFLFFVCLGVSFVGFLAGGIPMAIGLSRIATFYYFRRNR